jgi:hypothetical protein
MRQRETSRGGGGDRSRHTGHDRPWDAKFLQMRNLLAEATEDAGVSSLESDHSLPRQCLLGDVRVDLGLSG